MESKFKIGDAIQMVYPKAVGDVPKGTVGVIIDKPAMGLQDWRVKWEGNVIGYTVVYDQEIELASGVDQHPQRTISAPPKFILQYDLDSRSFEPHVSDKEVRERIAELAANSQLKRDSIRVYEIKSIRAATLGIKITIK